MLFLNYNRFKSRSKLKGLKYSDSIRLLVRLTSFVLVLTVILNPKTSHVFIEAYTTGFKRISSGESYDQKLARAFPLYAQLAQVRHEALLLEQGRNFRIDNQLGGFLKQRVAEILYPLFWDDEASVTVRFKPDGANLIIEIEDGKGTRKVVRQ